MDPNRVSVYLPTSDPDDPALRRALLVARLHPECRIELVDVLPEASGLLAAVLPSARSSEKLAREARAEELRELADGLECADRVSVHVETGPTALELVRRVLRTDSDLLLKTARNRGPEDAALGTVALRLMRLCPCPVWIVGPARAGDVVAAIDVGSEHDHEAALNRRILRAASWLAEIDQVTLRVIHAFDPTRILMAARHGDSEHLRRIEESARQEIERRLVQAVEDSGLDARDHKLSIVGGRPGDAIVEAMRKDARALVMGTVGRTGLRGFVIGNTAEAILRRIECSVLAVKPPTFVAPVDVDD